MRPVPLEPSVELLVGPRSAALGGVGACGLCHWSLRWSSLWGHDTLSWVAVTHADPASGTFGGAPYGATKCCPGWRGRMRPVALEPSMELPVGPRSAVLGGGDACG
eukprot:228675-Pyramimonas_sp.AAC.1